LGRDKGAVQSETTTQETIMRNKRKTSKRVIQPEQRPVVAADTTTTVRTVWTPDGLLVIRNVCEPRVKIIRYEKDAP